MASSRRAEELDGPDSPLPTTTKQCLSVENEPCTSEFGNGKSLNSLNRGVGGR